MRPEPCVTALALSAALLAMPMLPSAAAAEADEPKGYMVGLVTVENKDWVKPYRAKNSQLLKKHGGRILVRGKPVEILEGTGPNGRAIVIVEFPSMENVRAWYNDPEYRPLIELRQSGSTADFMLLKELPR